MPAYVIVDIQHVYTGINQPESEECNSGKKTLTAAIIPERDAFVALGEMRAFKTVLVFKSRLQLRSAREENHRTQDQSCRQHRA